jgi:hypothetical protein
MKIRLSHVASAILLNRSSNTSAQNEVSYSTMYQEDINMKPYFVHPNNMGGDNNTTLNHGLMLQEQTNQFIPESRGSGLSLPSSLEFPSSVLRSLLVPSVEPLHAFHQNSSIGIPTNDGEGPNRWLESSMNSNINATYFDKVSSMRHPLQFTNESPFWNPSGVMSNPSNVGTSIFNGNNAAPKVRPEY